MKTNQDLHPDDLELELYRTGESLDHVSAHLENCVDCREKLIWLQKLGQECITNQVPISKSVDDSIMAFAKTRAQKLKSSQKIWKWAYATIPMAATLLATVVVMQFIGQNKAAFADVNGDGQVNIIDALMLQKAIEGQQELKRQWDINQDRVIDEKDAQWIANLSVQLSRGKS